MRNVLIVAGIVVLMAGAGLVGWLVFGDSIPRRPPFCRGAVASVRPAPEGGLDVVIPNYIGNDPLYLHVPPGTPIRRRAGGDAQLQVGQQVSVWVHTFGNAKHLWADATFIVVEPDG
jgi:hypothetical protein